MKAIQELKPFNDTCDEFISGKYILADIKIASILKQINENEKLKNIISSCLHDYDFNEEFKKCAIITEETSNLTLPKDEDNFIAFVYNLLYKFKSENIKFYDFLTQFFSNENSTGKEFSNFANTVILPFKNSINNIYAKRHILVETDEFQNNIYNKIMSTIKLILKNLEAYKLNMNQKEEFSMLLNSLHLASEKNDKKLVYSLMIGLDYFTKSNKKSRIAYLSLEECFEK